MSLFDSAISKVLKNEGGFVNNSADRGGKTNFGITETLAKSCGYTGDMETLPIETAKAIYKKEFWDKLKCDQINNSNIAMTLFDISVQVNPFTAITFIQKILWLLTGTAMVEDGIMGGLTLKTLNDVSNTLTPQILELLNFFIEKRYVNLATNDSSQKQFLKGWLNRIIQNRENGNKI